MYCGLDDLKKLQPESVLLQLTDDDNDGEFDAEEPNAAYSNVVTAINDADTFINSYLSGRYDVPVTGAIPGIVVQISAHLALCNLYGRRRELDLPEGISSRRKTYVKLLEDIKAEKADIPELSKSSPAMVTVDKTETDRAFPDDLLSAM
jgi:phage gp36-like protein